MNIVNTIIKHIYDKYYNMILHIYSHSSSCVPCWWVDVDWASRPDHCVYRYFRGFFLFSLSIFMYFFPLLHNGFPWNAPFCAFCHFVPSAVLCLLSYCAFCRIVYSVVMCLMSFRALCRFVRLSFRGMPFCMCIIKEDHLLPSYYN